MLSFSAYVKDSIVIRIHCKKILFIIIVYGNVSGIMGRKMKHMYLDKI